MKEIKDKQQNKNQNLPTGWRKVKLGKFVNINPNVQIQRGEKYPFLDMADVIPLSRTIEWPKRKMFNGFGIKFEEGDTLFARITPCLENGKITQAKNLKSPAFGSSEFYVLRGNRGIADSDFVYYLSRTFHVRKSAESSMIGASGRQRVERSAFENIEVEVPIDINEQRRIASILSAFDDKIELNNKINKTLEEMAQAIFKHWFVKNQKSKIKNQKLGELAKITYGKGPASNELKKRGYPIYGANGIIGYCDSYSFSDRQIIIGCRGVVGNVTLTLPKCTITHNSLVLTPLNNRKTFLYYLLKNQKLDAIAGGSAQPQITIRDLENFELIIPDEKMQDKFESIATIIEQQRLNNFYENQKLVELRDLLLPKLMSGEMRV